ncbi:MAG: glycosyltransferase, partial [Acidobacteriota bacterium]
MRILFTNHALAERSGTEVYLRDIVLELLKRGHEPVAYSRRLGDVARELRRATVPVVDDLDELLEPPDLIHAQHHLEAMTALARFPLTPAVYLCHGWLPDPEAPPRHPQIRLYGAVDDLVMKRLVEECGIPAERTRWLPNFVDLRRFRPRPGLPERPKKALVFSNYVSEENCLDAIRHACLQWGLQLDVVGRAHGRSETAPEHLLGQYDVVFAKGRSALEAAAVGSAVVLCDAAGLGPLVTAAEFARLRKLNFGVRLLRRDVTPENILKELQRYDPHDAAEVQRLMTEQCSLEGAADRLEAVYREVLQDAEAEAPPREELDLAVSGYLRWGPLTGGDLHSSERGRLEAEVAHHRARVREIRKAADRLREDKIRQSESILILKEKVGDLRGRLRAFDDSERDANELRHREQAEAERLRREESASRQAHLEKELQALRRDGEALLELAAGATAAEKRAAVDREKLASRFEALETAQESADERFQDQLDCHEQILDAERTARARAEQSALELRSKLDKEAAELRWMRASLTWKIR